MTFDHVFIYAFGVGVCVILTFLLIIDPGRRVESILILEGRNLNKYGLKNSIRTFCIQIHTLFIVQHTFCCCKGARIFLKYMQFIQK